MVHAHTILALGGPGKHFIHLACCIFGEGVQNHLRGSGLKHVYYASKVFLHNVVNYLSCSILFQLTHMVLIALTDKKILCLLRSRDTTTGSTSLSAFEIAD